MNQLLSNKNELKNKIDQHEKNNCDNFLFFAISPSPNFNLTH